MAKLRWLLMLNLVIGLLFALTGVQAQTVESEYFPVTGHNVRGEFLRFFKAHGGLDILGYPITEEFVEDGRLVQYFQRMRLDAYPENPEADRVKTGPIAQLLERGDPPISPDDLPMLSDPNQRYFAETGHTVSYAFLTFFEAHTGVDFLGLPITEFKLENGRIVQYFQCARLEWHPDLPAEHRVRLGNLGEAYAALKLTPDRLNPPPALLEQVVTLRPLASLHSAITGRNGQQRIHVYVMDQQGRPVSQATVTAVVHFPTGQVELSLPQTDGQGYTSTTFDLEGLTPGQRIVVHVRVEYAGLSAATRTSFLVWW